jgi:DNA-binding transcriptional LysR family regulator
MPRLEELRALCTVVEAKSFSGAADRLGLSQPAVSLQIKSLEQEYGIELLHRGGEETLPTQEGLIAYETACEILDLFDRSKLRVQELTSLSQGRLLIGGSTGPGEVLLPTILGSFKSEHPHVDLALRVGDSGEIIDRIRLHQLEIGFVGSFRRDRNLSFEPFLSDQLILVVSPDHPWAPRDAIDYEELTQAALILQQQGSGATAALCEALANSGIALSELNAVLYLGLQESTKAAVRSGLGVTIISRLGVLEELARGVLVEVPVRGLELTRDFYVTYLRSTPLTALARAFVDFAHSQAEAAVRGIEDSFRAQAK